ncbi:MAG: AMP-binding protein, partial [Armatimonadetes bacterium]|nr:AMP-binding protein [Armatimonadota bacterium]
RFMVSGGAALPFDVGRWFLGIGLPIIQGFGLTETSPAICLNDPDGDWRLDTVGPPLDGVELMIAADGEILSRGPHIMAGYYEMPEETAEAIDPEGWFHTGDIGEVTPEGHLRITDRKKNIMVLANGKNVAPVPIEDRLRSSPLISQIMLIGDNQNVVTALIVPAFDALERALAEQGEPATGREAILASKTAEKLIRAEIQRLSGDLAPFEVVRKFRLLPQEFSLEREEMTPTLKLRRRQILENYRELVREMAE